MITVNDALSLPVLQGSRLVAGYGGVNRAIDWVHNVSVPDAARWLKGGELVLTTPNTLPEDAEGREAYLMALIERDVAALGLSVGQQIKEVPPHLCHLADMHDFPLIAVPYQLYFLDVAREINRRIAQRDVRRALDIHHKLTQLVLDGNLEQLAQTLARLVQQSVSIENDRFESYHSVNIAAVDEARRYTQQHGRTDPRLVEALDKRGYIPEIERTLRPVHLPQMPDVGLEMERILAPIVVHGKIYGFVWIIADDRPFTDLERMAIESGATVAALMMLREEAVQREDASRRGSLLTSLLQGDIGERVDVLTDLALRYGIDLRQTFRVLVVEDNTRTVADQTDTLNRTTSGDEWRTISTQFAGRLVMMVQDDAALSGRVQQICNWLTSDLSDAHRRLRIGVSAAHTGANAVATAYEECRESLDIAAKLAPSQQVVTFDSLGYLHALYRAGPGTLRGNLYLPALQKLQVENHADLFHTLEVYLDGGGNGVATAEALHIHRSTLNYRLSRIAEICTVDLSDPFTRTNLQMAVKLMRLFGNAESG